MNDLLKNKKSGWEEVSEDEKNAIFTFSNEYMNFLNNAKTEREIIRATEVLARQNGFKSLDEYSELYPGDKVYFINRGKNIYLAVIGTREFDTSHKELLHYQLG